MSANRQYKSSFFATLFKDPDKMLELYNALTGKNLPPDSLIEPATLEDALFMDRINDIAFVVEGRLVVLVEQQSLSEKSDNDCYPNKYIIRAKPEKQVMRVA